MRGCKVNCVTVMAVAICGGGGGGGFGAYVGVGGEGGMVEGLIGELCHRDSISVVKGVER